MNPRPIDRESNVLALRHYSDYTPAISRNDGDIHSKHNK